MAKARDWRRIGRLRLTESYNADPIHFHHPGWRENRSDPACAIRANQQRERS